MYDNAYKCHDGERSLGFVRSLAPSQRTAGVAGAKENKRAGYEDARASRLICERLLDNIVSHTLHSAKKNIQLRRSLAAAANKASTRFISDDLCALLAK
ncbi:unnamed protein product [Leptosia nina]|uniref:Uncharacterized protein n=1 Tax=Leptosia nina TaxID=320188 RepID=A0AAV1K0C5_9NEOP